MSLREKGKEILKVVLKEQSNINIFERMIYNYFQDEKGNVDSEIYLESLYQLSYNIMNKTKLKQISGNVKSGNILWKDPLFTDIKNLFKEQDDFLENPFEIEEGVIECRCGSKRVFSYSKQSRSADEPSTTYAECAECNAKWQYSG